MQKLVYSFNEGSKDMKNLLGDKGANLSEMTKIGLRVPFGFIATTEACNQYYAEGEKLSEDLITEIEYQIEVLENVTGKKFGDRENPLLVSVRSSAEKPMTGIMDDTILNLGLNDEIADALASSTENPDFAYDSYRRFIQMYGVTVMGISKAEFENIFECYVQNMQRIVCEYKELIHRQTGEEFPQEPKKQLVEAIQAIFRYNHCMDEKDTAVVVQSMVFGNTGNDSGTGVAFTRNPESGNHELCGRLLIDAQGEDVEFALERVKSINDMEESFPEAYKDLLRIANVLEKHYKDMQRIEFTVDCNRLHILQTATAARSSEAALLVAVDMVEEGLISKETAIERLNPCEIEQLLHNGLKDSVYVDAFNRILSWTDEIRMLKVRTNADNVEILKLALIYGAEGIGLCRTEHMFYEADQSLLIQKVMLVENEEERKDALAKILPYQKADFKRIYEVMEDKPVTIRLLDPPHLEYLSCSADFQEFNPLLGHRGCRLAVTYPEIASMQTRAIVEAAIEMNQENNIDIVPEIMIPMVSTDTELEVVKDTIISTIEECKKEYNAEIDYFIGTMIEVPRAALTAGEIAKEVEFFSFGTNDLTQMVFGLSRNDTEKLIEEYIQKGIFDNNPFQTIDKKGVGKLMADAVKSGRQTRPSLKLGVCGEHGGDPDSIEFFHKLGLHYVSCSPEKVPVAKIAAAQAAIKNKKEQ